MNIGSDYLQPKAARSSSQGHRSSQEYPLFTPQYAKYYEETLFGNSAIVPNGNKCEDSGELLEKDDCITRLTLEDGSDIQGFDATPRSLHKQAGKTASNVNLKPEALVHHKRIESSPSGHVLDHKTKSRRRNTGFPAYLHQRYSNAHYGPNIPPGEILYDITLEDIDQGTAEQESIAIDGKSQNVKESVAIGGKPPDVIHTIPRNRCMEFCDACLPGSKVTIVPLTDTRDSVEASPKERNLSNCDSLSIRSGTKPIMSWFRSKKTYSASSQAPVSKNIKSDAQSGVSEILRPMEKFHMDGNGRDLSIIVSHQANEEKDVTVSEVVKLKMAVQEMNKKVECLQAYCQMLQQGQNCMRIPDATVVDEHLVKVSSGCTTLYGPTKAQFYHAVSEARLGVKQFCRAFLHEIQEQSSTENIENILQPYNVRIAPRISKNVRYHIEAIMNQAFFEDFENIKFQRNGTNYVLDPRKRPSLFYKSYMTISQMGWTELINKESNVYSESFDAFCDQKMSRVEKLLNWDGRWPDELVRSFFIAANWVWLLHLLAFSFESPAVIFRVGSEDTFNSSYMEELAVDQNGKARKLNGKGADLKIKVMVVPGFFFERFEVVKCKVLLSRTHEISN